MIRKNTPPFFLRISKFELFCIIVAKKWGLFKHGNIPFYWVISGKTRTRVFQNITEETTGNLTATIISHCEDFFGRPASPERRFQYPTFCRWIVCISRYGTFYESSSNRYLILSRGQQDQALKKHSGAKCTEHSTDVLDGLCLCTNLVHYRFKLFSKGKPCIDIHEVRIELVQLTQFSSFRHISVHNFMTSLHPVTSVLPARKISHILGQTPPTLEPVYRRLASNSQPLFV